MEPTDQLAHILPTISSLVDRVKTIQLDDPTPCDDFTVHDVLDHMIVGGGTFAHLFRGDPPPEIAPPAVYGWVPTSDLRGAMEDLLDAVRSPGAMDRTVTTPLGELDGATFARFVALDGLAHAWDVAVATDNDVAFDPRVVADVLAFAHLTLSDDIRGDRFAPPTEPPRDASELEVLAAFTGRSVQRWSGRGPSRREVHMHIDKNALPVKIDAPGATARQLTRFGSPRGYDSFAAEYFSIAAGTDLAPLLEGLEHDMCAAPHWGYLLEGDVEVAYADGATERTVGGELFYWPPGHSVRIVEDAELIIFSPHEHVAVLDHMLAKMADA